MSKIKTTQVDYQDLVDLLNQPKPNYKLVREYDGLTHHSVDILWLEWEKDGKFKEKHKEPAIGRSLLMSPFNDFFTWHTTVITEIVEQKEGYLKFKTENSIYELSSIEQNIPKIGTKRSDELKGCACYGSNEIHECNCK